MKEYKRWKWNIKRVTAIVVAVIMLHGSLLSAMPTMASATETTADSQEVIIHTTNRVLSGSWQQSLEYTGSQTDSTSGGVTGFKGFQNQGTLYLEVSKETRSLQLLINGIPIDTSKMTKGKTTIYEVDYSSIAQNGTNTIQVNQVKPNKANVKIYIPYPEVIKGNPEDVGMDVDTIELIDGLVTSEIEYGFSAAQLAVVKDGKLVVNQAWGNVTGWTQNGTMDKSSAKVTTDTLFDLASNTKMYTVNYAIQKLVSDGKLNLDEKVSTYIPEFQDDAEDTIKGKSQIVLRSILKHQAGFPATWKYYNENLAGNLYCQNRDEMLDKIIHTPLEYTPGTKTVYSDLDYMLLCFLVERITGQRFDTYLEENIYAPLGLTHTTFQPLLHGFTRNDCAATELNGNTRDGAVKFKNIRTNIIQGEVHDEKAYYSMGGISGHAGLFSTASELAKLCQVMINDGGYGENSFFSADVIDEFTKGKGYDTSASAWGLGWWREADNSTRIYYFGPQSSSDTYGHQGWTGTLTVIDPESNLIIVLLTNKKNSPVIDNKTAENDFVCDNYALGSLGIVSGYVYEALNNKNDAALDANAYTTALERVKQFSKRLGTYDTTVHLTDSYAMVDWLAARAEYRKTDESRDYAQKLLNEVNAIVDQNRINGKISEDSIKAADDYKQNLQKQIDSLKTEPEKEKSLVLKTRRVAELSKETGAQAILNFPSLLGAPTNGKLFAGNLYTFKAYPSRAVLYACVTTEHTDGMRMFLNGYEVDISELKANPGTAYAIDFAEICLSDRNTIQVSGISREVAAGEGIRVYLNYPVVTGNSKKDTLNFDFVEEQIQNNVGNKYKAQLTIIKDGIRIEHKAFGKGSEFSDVYSLGTMTNSLSSLFMIEKTLSEGLISIDVNESNTLDDLLLKAEKATGMIMSDYVQINIFQKMRLDNIELSIEPDSEVTLCSNSESLAKLGQMVLNDGGYGSYGYYSKNIGEYFQAISDNNPGRSFCWMRQGDARNTEWFGSLASRKTIGCFSWEGSFLIIDPEQNLIIAYTTNVPKTQSVLSPGEMNTEIYKALMRPEGLASMDASVAA